MVEEADAVDVDVVDETVVEEVEVVAGATASTTTVPVMNWWMLQ